MAESIHSATGATEQDANAAYSLGSSPGESARLQRQAVELAADSTALLDRVSLRPGQRAIDLGCGPRGSWTSWPSGSRQQAGSSAWTPTPRTPPWQRNSLQSEG
jgi:hypothetical protein